MIEHIDNANDIENMKMWPRILSLLDSPQDPVIYHAAWICGTAIQNNMKAQQAVSALTFHAHVIGNVLTFFHLSVLCARPSSQDLFLDLGHSSNRLVGQDFRSDPCQVSLLPFSSIKALARSSSSLVKRLEPRLGRS